MNKGVQKGTSLAMIGYLHSWFVDQPGPKSSCTKAQTLPFLFLFALPWTYNGVYCGFLWSSERASQDLLERNMHFRAFAIWPGTPAVHSSQLRGLPYTGWKTATPSLPSSSLLWQEKRGRPQLQEMNRQSAWIWQNSLFDPTLLLCIVWTVTNSGNH